VVAFAGAALALWLVREREIEREAPMEVAPEEGDQVVELLAA
jgi:hypothetical protein